MKIKNILFEQKGSVTIEFIAMLILILVMILFMLDLFVLISWKGKLERTSYSLLNIVKESRVIAANTGTGDIARDTAFQGSLQDIANLLVSNRENAGISYFVERATYQPQEQCNAGGGVSSSGAPSKVSMPCAPTYTTFSNNDAGGHCRPKILLTDSDKKLFNGVWENGGRRSNANTLAQNLSAFDTDNSYTPVYRVTVCMPHTILFAKLFHLVGVNTSDCGAGKLCASSIGIGR